MKKRMIPFLILSAILVYGCSQTRSVVEVTCKPQFESKLRPELIVTGPEGARADAADLILVLSHGGQQYRFPWGTPPLFHGPVALSKHLTYTFTLDTFQNSIVSIREGKNLIYEARK